MTIDKAIEILSQSSSYTTEDFWKAANLGIEALKRCKVVSEGYQFWHEKPLPGETRKVEAHSSTG